MQVQSHAFGHAIKPCDDPAQYELAIDAAPNALATAHEALGLELGRDYARFGLTPPMAYLYPQSPLQRGWLSARGARLIKPHSHTGAWLALRTQAWAHGHSFEEVQLTPHFLQQLDAGHCPITRETLEAGNRCFERVRHDAGYAAGNLVQLSRRALGEALTQAEQQRLDTLRSFVTALPHDEAARLPLHVLPSNRLRLFNPIQALQTLLTRQMLRPGWSARLAGLEARLQNDAVRTEFNRFVLSLAPRALEAARLDQPEQIRWALEDAWALPLVQERWIGLALKLGAAQTQSLVEHAAALKLDAAHVRTHAPASSTEGWALQSQGYQAA